MLPRTYNDDDQKPERNIFLIILIFAGIFVGLFVLLALLKIAFFTLGWLWQMLVYILPTLLVLVIGYLLYRLSMEKKLEQEKRKSIQQQPIEGIPQQDHSQNNPPTVTI
ncbi:MAG: hypothetical protein WCP97_01725 [bacterium]